MNTEETKKPEIQTTRYADKHDTRIHNLIANLNDPVMLRSAERVIREQQENVDNGKGTVDKQ